MKYLPHSYTLCLEYSELVPCVISPAQFKKAKAVGKLIVAQKSGYGDETLIEYETLPEDFKHGVRTIYGDPYEYQNKQPILRLLQPDNEAREYFSNYLLDTDKYLPLEAQYLYRRQSEWFNLVIRMTEDKRALKDLLRIDMDAFYKLVLSMHPLDRPVNPKLPVTYDAFQKKLRIYKKDGYASLIDKRFGNRNAQKVTPKIEGLLLSLYCMPTKPYLSEVCRMYKEFITGKRKVVDMETGEVYDPKDFFVPATSSTKQSQTHDLRLTTHDYYTVSAETVRHYISKPLNRIIVDAHRMSRLEFDTTHMPSMLRKAPVYAFSKITMDDTSSPFKMHDNTRPACYKIFDVASGALIALAMHRRNRPDAALIRTALADMMQQIIINGWKMPHEIEVENAITSGMTGNTNRKGLAGEKDREKNGLVQDVLSAGAVFPIVHFCAPENPKEKRAEGFIKQIKYKFQKHREGFQHRIFARLEANRANKDSDSHKMRFGYEEIETFEREDASRWNQEPHPDQQLYPGKTRWQVLEQCQNPGLHMPNLPQVMKYVGYRTDTSVRRMRVTVQYNSYKLPSLKIFERLNNANMEAYWLPDTSGAIPQVYLYQGGEFVTYGIKEERFQEARIEQTKDDLKIMGAQRRYKEEVLGAIKKKGMMVKKVGTITEHTNYKLPTLPIGRQVTNSNVSVYDEQEELGKYADRRIRNWNNADARVSALEEI